MKSMVWIWFVLEFWVTYNSAESTETRNSQEQLTLGCPVIKWKCFTGTSDKNRPATKFDKNLTVCKLRMKSNKTEADCDSQFAK